MILRASGGEKRGRAAMRLLWCLGQNVGLFRNGDQIAIKKGRTAESPRLAPWQRRRGRFRPRTESRNLDRSITRLPRLLWVPVADKLAMDIAKWVIFGCRLMEQNVGKSACPVLFNLQEYWRSHQPCRNGADQST